MLQALGYTVEHLGIAVADEAAAVARYTQLLGVGPYKDELVEREGVKTIFFRTGESKIELLVATRPDSPVAKFIEKRGEGLHHVAFAVPDLDAALAHLEAEGAELIDRKPRRGGGGARVAFVHPRTFGGTLTELVEIS